MATLQELREEAGLSVSDLAKRADVDYKIIKKADERSGSIHRFKALAILQVINQELGTELELEDIDGLTLH
jgi:transcriptional regulator with XRE-family HTH domain